jgi:apolipoprotein N-acyltransferase
MKALTRQVVAVPLAGILASLALPPIHIFPFLFFLSVPAAMLLNAGSKRSAFLIGWGTGIGWFVVSLYWISNALVTGGSAFYWMIPFAALLFPAGLALFWGFAFLLAWCCFTSPASRLTGLCFWLMVMEWLRGTILTGFPWQTPGMAFAFSPVGFDLVSIFGVYGCGVAAILLGLLPVMIYWRQRLGGMRMAVVTAIIMMIFLGAAVLVSGRPLEDTAASGLRIRMVQPSIPQQEKWDRSLRAEHLQQHIALSLSDQKLAQNNLADADAELAPDLIIWGEVSYAGVLENDLPYLGEAFRAASQMKSWLVLGSLYRQDFNPGPAYYNSMFLMSPDARIVGRYDKQFLVPWGEFVPLRHLFPFVDKLVGGVDFSAGSGPVLLPLQRHDGRVVQLAPLICYEIIYPASTRQASDNADLLVNVTNDAWFGNSIGPRQHLAMARMRSAELGLPMVRVATTGISAVIDPYGNIVASIGYDVNGSHDAVIKGRTKTLYSNWGETGFVLLLMTILSLGFVFRHQDSTWDIT